MSGCQHPNDTSTASCGRPATCDADVRCGTSWTVCEKHARELAAGGVRVDGLDEENDDRADFGDECAREDQERAEIEWQEGPR